MKDMHSRIAVLDMFGPVSLNADNTPVAVDIGGFGSVEIILGIGVGGITFNSTDKIEFKLSHSDDDSTYVNVTDADMLGVSGISNGIIKALTAAHAAAAHYRFGYRGNKKFLKLLADFSGTHGTATPLDAMIVAGNPLIGPVAADA